MPCSKCPPRGHCCKFKYSTGFVFVGTKDADNIRKKYGTDYQKFLHLKKFPMILVSFMKKEPSYSEAYVRYTQLKDGRLPVLKIKKNGDCIFLKSGACAIYKDRPLVCQLYPYWFLPAEKIHIIPHDTDLKCRLLKEKDGRAQLTKSELKRCISLAKKIMKEERDFHKHAKVSRGSFILSINS